MCGNNYDRGISEGPEKTPPRRLRRFRVHTEAAVELRLGALQRGMHDVATDDHRSASRLNHDTDVTRGVPRPRLDPYAVIKGIVHGDELGLATVHDRQQAVFIIRVGSVTGSQISYPPVFPLLAGE